MDRFILSGFLGQSCSYPVPEALDRFILSGFLGQSLRYPVPEALDRFILSGFLGQSLRYPVPEALDRFILSGFLGQSSSYPVPEAWTAPTLCRESTDWFWIRPEEPATHRAEGLWLRLRHVVVPAPSTCHPDA